VSSPDRIAASRTVAASPAEIFRIVTDPAMHVEIDGSGMLEAAAGAQRLEAPGDTFVMDMDREPLGDVAMGKYKSVNTVTRIVPDALLEWNVGVPDRGPYGHVYGWEITAVGPGETEITNYCEWPNIPEKARPYFPIVPLAMLEKSVANLSALVSRGSQPPD
jgi:uncharacterized protein YndB with AHSA1/START domain